MTAFAWLGLALLAGGSPPPDTLPHARLHVLVRLDQRASIGDAMMAAVAADVRTIWKPYGVDLAFAASFDTSGAEYDEDLRLVITDRLTPPSGLDRGGLGWIEFLAPGRPARTLTVSAAAALNLVQHASWAGSPVVALPVSVRNRFLTHALSRAAAHEIGHYLLRSTAHARRGLMRRGFTVVEIMGDGLGPYRLEASEVAGLERRLAEGMRAGSPRVTS